MQRLILVLLVSILLPAKDVPTLTPDQRAKFWRAQAEAIAAQMQVQKAQARLDAVLSELKASCNGDIEFNSSGEPSCKAPADKK